jgi:hypothetical protein
VKTDTGVFERGPVRRLFPITGVTGRGPNYDVSVDGQKILVNSLPVLTEPTSAITPGIELERQRAELGSDATGPDRRC